jgi:hypothetical protein
MQIDIDMGGLDVLFDTLNRFQYYGVNEPAERAANKLVYKLRSNILTGQDSAGDHYPLIQDSTMDMQIKREAPYSDHRIRRDVSTDPRAMNVTGRSIESLNVQKVKATELNVGFDDERSQIVFESNARNSGSSNKPKRDPLGLSAQNPSDREIDIVAEEIEKELDNLLDGF